MTDNNPSPFKLKNPTEYHLLATQTQANNSLGHQGQQQTDALEDQQIGFSDYYTQQQFLAPSLNSTPLQDFDELDSPTNNGITIFSASAIADMIGVPEQQQQHYGLQSQQLFLAEDTPSEYSSSLDPFSHNSQHTSYLMELHNGQNSLSNGVTIQNDALPLVASPNMLSSNRLCSSLGDQHGFSAPAHIDYNFMGGHIGGLAYQHQTPDSNSYSNSLTATGSRSLDEYESIQMTHQLLSEKKRRRRESHNAVERRRRETINERIQELGTMLPETMLEELASVNLNGNNNNKPNKGAILRKSVDHIRILQQEVANHKQRIYELERQLASLSS